MVTDVGVPIAHAWLELLVTRADLIAGATVLTEVIAREHQHEQAPLPPFRAHVS